MKPIALKHQLQEPLSSCNQIYIIVTLPKDPIKAQEYREKCRLRNLGKKMSKESRDKVSASLLGNKRNLGKKRSVEERKLRSIRMSGELNYFYGKHHTKETIEKIRKSKIGSVSPMKGKNHTEGAKDKLSLHHIGRPKEPRVVIQDAPDDESRLIPLTRGYIAIVDAEDYDRLNAFLWGSHKDHDIVYAVRARSRFETDSGKWDKMHWAVIGKPKKGLMIDHINGNGLDNRKKNLRVVTNRQNCQNRHHATGVSKYPGVYYEKRTRKWIAQAQINGKNLYIGSFTTEELASDAYKRIVEPLEIQKIEELQHDHKTN